MEEHTLSFCKFYKHSESLLEVIVDKSVDLGLEHANEVNNKIKTMFKVPYGVLVDIKKDFSFSFEGGVKIGNSKFEKKVALLINNKKAENTARCVKLMQKDGFPDKELKIFYDREAAIKWLEDI